MNMFRHKQHALILSCALSAFGCLPGVAMAGHGDSESGPRHLPTEQYNKQIVTKLAANMLGTTDLDSLGHYFAPFLIQHDPLVPNGRAAMLANINQMRQVAPAQALTVKHILADRDLVFVHAQVSATPVNEMSGINRWDVYRLDHGVIVETWSVKAKAPTKSANGNSQFSNLYKYPVPPLPLTDERVEMNRLMVKGLSEDVFSRRKFGLLDTMWGTDYIQHNPAVKSGRAALAAVIEYIAPEGGIYRVTRSIADGDLSMVCAQGNDPGANPKDEFSGWVVCDMYRVDNFQLVEHWDVGQNVPSTSINGNSMFSNLYRRY